MRIDLATQSSLLITMPAEQNKTKMDVAKEAVNGILDRLTPDDRVGIVLFSDSACVGLRLGRVGCLNRETLKQTVQSEVQPLASTNMGAGVNLSVSALRGCAERISSNPEDWENRVIVLTGGHVRDGGPSF